MDSNSEFELTIKLLIVGDSTVGKTNFIYKFTDDKFKENYFASTGIDLKTTSIKIDGKNIKLHLWDTAGQEKYKSMTKSLFLKAQGIIALFDVTNESSFINLKNWLALIEEECNPDMPIIIVGNKIDLVNKRVIEKEKAMDYANQKKIEYLETSSKTGENIIKAITLLSEQILENSESIDDVSFRLDSISLQKRKKCC